MQPQPARSVGSFRGIFTDAHFNQGRVRLFSASYCSRKGTSVPGFFRFGSCTCESTHGEFLLPLGQVKTLSIITHKKRPRSCVPEMSAGVTTRLIDSLILAFAEDRHTLANRNSRSAF